MNTQFTESELESLHMLAAFAMNGLMSCDKALKILPSAQEIVDTAYEVAEAMIIRGSHYIPSGK